MWRRKLSESYRDGLVVGQYGKATKYGNEEGIVNR